MRRLTPVWTRAMMRSLLLALPVIALPARDAAVAQDTGVTTAKVYSHRVTEPRIDVPDEDFVEILSIPELPAGQYIVTGHIEANNRDREAPAYLACFLRADGETPEDLGATVTFFQENRGGGVADAKSVPVAGHLDVESGPVELRVECQRQGGRGLPVIRGGSGLTQLIAAWVGDAPEPRPEAGRQ